MPIIWPIVAGTAARNSPLRWLTMMQIQCRAVDQGDLDEVVRIHRIAFPRFFLTRMGPHFLRSYYQAVLDFNTSIAVLACDQDNGKALGFAVGFGDPSGFYRFFKERRRKLLPIVLLALLRDPSLLVAILRNAQRVSAQAHGNTAATELSSIAVGDAGRGVGSALLDAFMAKARFAEAATVCLTTDAKDNDDVIRFYEKHGFRLLGHEDRGDRRLLHYEKVVG